MKILFCLLLGFSVLQAQVKEVKIGTQVWMVENLKVFYFTNGDAIPIVKSDKEWLKACENKQPACCYYENNAEYGKTYGVLYNSYAIIDKRGLAPVGYHIPTDEEWKILADYLGGIEVAGTKMKSTSGWNSYNGELKCNVCKSWSPEQKAGQTCTTCNDTRKTKARIPGNGTNESGFNGLPGGARSGVFYHVGDYGYWWGFSLFYRDSGILRMLKYDDGSFERTILLGCKGIYVRCLRD